VAPLFWGLGHSSRCIPIINQLLDQGNTVAIASDGEALSLLRMELPDLESFELPEYDINYKYQSMIINMAVQGPKVLSAIKKEKTVAQQIASSWNADIYITSIKYTPP
jgi:UDP:flavonoid glycosyltransferase YjiC (YdhE family)